MRGLGVVVCVALLGPRAARADDRGPAPSVTVAPPSAAAAPPPPPAPSALPQASDPDAPVHLAPEASTSRSAVRTNETELVAGEVVVAALVATGLGIGGYYAVSYQPTYMTIPRSTAGSTALNVAGLVALMGAPALAGTLVCGVGRWSTEYGGSCGWSVGLAYLGLLAPSFAWLATTGKQPPNCYDCAIPGPSVPAILVSYVVGVATGAVLGWNLSKQKRDDALALQSISRAGPPPASVGDWTLPAPRWRVSEPLGLSFPVLAFAF